MCKNKNVQRKELYNFAILKGDKRVKATVNKYVNGKPEVFSKYAFQNKITDLVSRFVFTFTKLYSIKFW